MAPSGALRADLFREARVGVLDESTLPIVGRGKAFGVGNLHMPEYWPATKQSYLPELAQWMEENVVNER